MNRKHILTLAFSFSLMLLSAAPVFAGDWIERVNNTWEYRNDDGESISGWINDGDNTYYLDLDGIKKTGWFKSKGSWYYFKENGTLESDNWVDNYYVNEEGKWTKTK